MSKIWSPDEENFVYAENLQSAKEVFHEYMEYCPPDDEWQEFALNTVAHATELIGIGGYNTIDFEDIIRWSKAKAPHFFGNIEDEYNRLGEDIE